MIKLLCDVPKNVYLACSGGVDSMAALDFLRRKHKVTVAFFDHGTTTSYNALSFVYDYCKDNGIGFLAGKINSRKLIHISQEEHWRNERYKFLDSIGQPVVTAHHLDDAVETWVWSSMHGQPKTPLVQRGNIIRPFLTTPKLELMDWCIRKNVPWYDDPTNAEQKYMRNYIRHTAMPVIEHINPGIRKTVAKQIKANYTTLY